MALKLRTPESIKHYEDLRKTFNPDTCAMCDKVPLKAFTHWKIVENSYPYDLIAKVHHMILPLRHVTEPGLTAEELDELKVIKQDLISKEYDGVIEALGKNKSFPAHFHLHLIIGKE